MHSWHCRFIMLKVLKAAEKANDKKRKAEDIQMLKAIRRAAAAPIADTIPETQVDEWSQDTVAYPADPYMAAPVSPAAVSPAPVSPAPVSHPQSPDAQTMQLSGHELVESPLVSYGATPPGQDVEPPAPAVVPRRPVAAPLRPRRPRRAAPVSDDDSDNEAAPAPLIMTKKCIVYHCKHLAIGMEPFNQDRCLSNILF